jgi:TPP-dependent 2-oxoacid decarboxylase
METSQSIGTYLIKRLLAHGVRHVLGVPGDYVLGFFQQLVDSPLRVVNTCDEQGAGFAADAYARVNGLGVVCVTYGVGGLKVANTTAQAFAEKSPVVVISGAPGMNERVKNPLLHHKVRDFDTQLKVFEQLTIASTVLADAETAFCEIDRVLAAAQRYKRPVYIEMPRDMVSAPGPACHQPELQAASDPDALCEAIHEAAEMINRAKQPVIIAGIELHRFGLQEVLVRLIEKTNIPVAALLLSKSVIGETHPRYLGVYEGALGYEDVRTYVESSDCLILLGAMMTEFDLGMYTAKLDHGRSICVTSEKTSVRHHVYEGILLQDFLQRLTAADITPREISPIPHPMPPAPFLPVSGRKITVERVFQRLNAFLDDNTVVIAEVGDSLFGSSDLFIHGHTQFLSPAYYASMGFAVPACVGAQLADPQRRPLVIVGDGGFQMTGMELSTAARFDLNPIVVVLNNSGYGTERPMLDGPFNDIHPWEFSRIPEIIGGGTGFSIETEEQLEAALQATRTYTDGFCILDIHLAPDDISPALQRVTHMLEKRVK